MFCICIYVSYFKLCLRLISRLAQNVTGAVNFVPIPNEK